MAFSKCSHVVSAGLVVIFGTVLQTICVQTVTSSQTVISTSGELKNKLESANVGLVSMSSPSGGSMGDVASLDDWIVANSKQRRVDSFGDEDELVPAAGHKKYILVKKKPKHKKIKMEVFEPKMKYKKIKMKIPVMKKKKKKVKGYLVKKEKHHDY